jgi:hypothetical protein
MKINTFREIMKKNDYKDPFSTSIFDGSFNLYIKIYRRENRGHIQHRAQDHQGFLRDVTDDLNNMFKVLLTLFM